METGIKYCGFFLYKKKINGVNRKMTRMICWEDTLGEAERNIRGRVFNNDKNKIEDYIISAYDITNDCSIKLSEHKVLL
jgi:hypothetical protein